MSDNVVPIDQPLALALTDKAAAVLDEPTPYAVLHRGDVVQVGKRLCRVTGWWQQYGETRMSLAPVEARPGAPRLTVVESRGDR